MKDHLRKKWNPAMQPCRQVMADCFARNRRGNCSLLVDTDYPCGSCPFYKTEKMLQEEGRNTYNRLVRIGRVDLILKYRVSR